MLHAEATLPEASWALSSVTRVWRLMGEEVSVEGRIHKVGDGENVQEVLKRLWASTVTDVHSLCCRTKTQGVPDADR